MTLNFEENKVGIYKVIGGLLLAASVGYAANSKLNNIQTGVSNHIGTLKTQISALGKQVDANHGQIIRELERRTSDRVTRSMVATLCYNLDRKSRDSNNPFRCEPGVDLPHYRDTLLPVVPRGSSPLPLTLPPRRR